MVGWRLAELFRVFNREKVNMASTLKYSIIYGVINPETSEQISLGIVIIDGEEISVKYSEKKMSTLQVLCSEAEYKFAARVVRSMNFASQSDVEYMIRYSNNLIALSPIQTVDLEANEKNKKWLYRNYVYAGA